MAEKLDEEMVRSMSSFSNSGSGISPRRPMPDMAEHRQYWGEAAVQAPPGMTVSATQHPNVEGGSEQTLHPREVEDALGSGMAARNAETKDTE
jgi:hypothetical protein